MKDEYQIRLRLSKIEDDERLSYKPADVRVNAPLALEQQALESQSDILRWVLDMPVCNHAEDGTWRPGPRS